jgi:beta-glucosidase
MDNKIKEILSSLTIEEKAMLCAGKDFWRTVPIEKFGVESVMMSDGPHGLRKQAEAEGGINTSITAVCFPTACATASTFDRDLMFKLGEDLGDECQAEDLWLLLGPAINIKRTPLCGRNFEYVSEDPYVSGELAAAYVNGLQSKETGASLKHYAANNQEFDRLDISAEIDERTLREIYLPGFETVVKKAQPWSVMCSYNRINGVHSSQNKWLLTDILREEWGFEGFVVSDWGAVSDRAEGIKAGLDLEMPGGVDTYKDILAAIKAGTLCESDIDRNLACILRQLFKHNKENAKTAVFDRAADHIKAAEMAKKCIVLLKNEEKILPLSTEDKGILFVGEFAEKPRYQGAGSSLIKTAGVTNPVDESRKLGAEITYVKGFPAASDVANEEWKNEAVEAAKSAKNVVVFAGLPPLYESEGYDRDHMRLPECQNDVIKAILAVNPNVIVVLHNGAPVEMPWVNDVKGIVEAYLCGEGVGEAVSAILFGKANPRGKLAETFPIRLQDNPSYLNYPGTAGKVNYAEGIFVGYRYYDAKEMDVLFPFGFGLSYTTFAVGAPKLSADHFTEGETLTVTVDVTNTGDRAGTEVVQLYIADKTNSAVRPPKELKGFEAVELQPGETKTAAFVLDKRSLAWYNTVISDWFAATGKYEILIGTSSRDICGTAVMDYTATTELPFKVDLNTVQFDLWNHPKLRDVMAANKPDEASVQFHEGDDPSWKKLEAESAKYSPIRSMRSFGNTPIEQINEMIAGLNKLLEK